MPQPTVCGVLRANRAHGQAREYSVVVVEARALSQMLPHDTHSALRPQGEVCGRRVKPTCLTTV